jgi:nitrate/nitrite transport system permease protein
MSSPAEKLFESGAPPASGAPPRPAAVAASATVVESPARFQRGPATARGGGKWQKRILGAARVVLPPFITLALLLTLWQILCSAPDASLPPPSKVLSDTWELITDPFYDRGGLDKGLFWHMLASLQRVALGYVLAAVAGVAFGVLVGCSVWSMRALDPLFQVLRTIPPLAWLPLSLAAFRNGQPSAIFVIFITAIWPIIINTAVGIRNIPQDYRNVARVLRLNGIEYFTIIMLPAAAPYIFTGLRIGIGLSWLAIVAAEMLVGGVGIGFFIWDAWNSSLISDIILALLYVGVVGFLLDRSIVLLARLVTRGTASS